MAYCDVGGLPDFLNEIAQRGLRHAVLAWRAEYGQHPTAAGVRYERLNLVTLLAYDPHTGCIVRTALEGSDRALVRRTLEQAGVNVEERSRNAV